MKKPFLLLTITTNMLIITAVSACPYEFSTDDTRPFFEQYEEQDSQPMDEKEAVS
jgi:hypothetical protein